MKHNPPIKAHPTRTSADISEDEGGGVAVGSSKVAYFTGCEGEGRGGYWNASRNNNAIPTNYEGAYIATCPKASAEHGHEESRNLHKNGYIQGLKLPLAISHGVQ